MRRIVNVWLNKTHLQISELGKRNEIKYIRRKRQIKKIRRIRRETQICVYLGEYSVKTKII
jgi:hypothetical protein